RQFGASVKADEIFNQKCTCFISDIEVVLQCCRETRKTLDDPEDELYLQNLEISKIKIYRENLKNSTAEL
ncbi:CLUMA_CG018111, isoform A, partial [Clunio marinus]